MTHSPFYYASLSTYLTESRRSSLNPLYSFQCELSWTLLGCTRCWWLLGWMSCQARAAAPQICSRLSVPLHSLYSQPPPINVMGRENALPNCGMVSSTPHQRLRALNGISFLDSCSHYTPLSLGIQKYIRNIFAINCQPLIVNKTLFHRQRQNEEKNHERTLTNIQK